MKIHKKGKRRSFKGENYSYISKRSQLQHCSRLLFKFYKFNSFFKIPVDEPLSLTEIIAVTFTGNSFNPFLYNG